MVSGSIPSTHEERAMVIITNSDAITERPAFKFLNFIVSNFISKTDSEQASYLFPFHPDISGNNENFYFSDLIENVLGENYIRCASQELFTKYYPGRLTKWLREQPVLSKEIKYYLCGSAEMVVEVRDFLISKEIPFQNIISETYF